MTINVTKKVMNNVFFAISDKYGWENVPYEYSDSAFSGVTTRIEICMWRYDLKFINNLFKENGLDYEANKGEELFLDAKDDIYKKETV